jgi:hypothetical protein
VAQQRLADAAAPRGLRRVHRLHLAMVGCQALQRAHAQQRLAVPGAEEADLGCAQPGQVEREGEARRRGLPRQALVQRDQRLHARILQAAFRDPHGCRPRSRISSV